MKTLRIAVLGTRGFPGLQGGVEQHCEQVYTRLAAMGHAVTVFVRPPYFDRIPNQWKGVQLIPLPCPRRKNLEAIVHSFRAARYIAHHREQFDLAHVHAIGPSLVIPQLKRACLPVVMTHHGPDYVRKKWGRFARIMLKQGENTACNHADAMITVARYLREALTPRCRGRVVYIPNGVYRPEKIAGRELLDTWALKPGSYLLAVGRWVPEKGFHDLVDAWKQVRTEKTLALVGDADHTDHYSASLKKNIQENHRIVATGAVPFEQCARLYHDAAGFVQASYHEGLPLTLLEALAYGCPALVSDIPAHREVITEPDQRFAPGDLPALARKLQRLADGAYASNLDALQRKVREHYNWDTIAKETDQVYQSLVSKT